MIYFFSREGGKAGIWDYKDKIYLLPVLPAKPTNDIQLKIAPYRSRRQFLYINGVSSLINDRETVRQATQTGGVRFFPISKSYIYFG